MNKKFLSIFLIISILSIAGCTEKEEVEVQDITIEESSQRHQYKKVKDENYVSQQEEDMHSNYPYNIGESEDASGYVYPENLIASRDWGADETDEMTEYLMNTVPDEDIETKQLIALVILNRVWTADFPTTVPDVIDDLKREKNIEYEEGLESDSECYEAVGNIQYEGWNESGDALYYTAKDDTETKRNYDENYEQVAEHGNYIFYR